MQWLDRSLLNKSAQVAARPREDSKMVAYLGALDQVSVTVVTVEESAPFDCPITLKVNSNRRAIGRKSLQRFALRLYRYELLHRPGYVLLRVRVVFQRVREVCLIRPHVEVPVAAQVE